MWEVSCGWGTRCKNKLRATQYSAIAQVAMATRPTSNMTGQGTSVRGARQPWVGSEIVTSVRFQAAPEVMTMLLKTDSSTTPGSAVKVALEEVEENRSPRSSPHQAVNVD